MGSDSSDHEFGFLSESTLGEDMTASRLFAGPPPFHRIDARDVSLDMSTERPGYDSPPLESDYSDTAGSMDNEPGSGKYTAARPRLTLAKFHAKMHTAR